MGDIIAKNDQDEIFVVYSHYSDDVPGFIDSGDEADLITQDKKEATEKMNKVVKSFIKEISKRKDEIDRTSYQYTGIKKSTPKTFLSSIDYDIKNLEKLLKMFS